MQWNIGKSLEPRFQLEVFEFLIFCLKSVLQASYSVVPVDQRYSYSRLILSAVRLPVDEDYIAALVAKGARAPVEQGC